MLWNHISRWRLGCKILVKKCWDQQPWKEERRCRTGQGKSWAVIQYQQRPQPIHEKLWNWIVPPELSWIGTRDSGLYTTSLMWICHWCDLSLEGSVALNEAIFSGKQSPNTAGCWRTSPGNSPSSPRTKSFITEGEHLGGAPGTLSHLPHNEDDTVIFFPVTNETMEAWKC